MHFAPLLRAAFAAAVLLAGNAQAQSAAEGDALYRALGSQPGLVSLVDTLMTDLLADERMNPFFKDCDQEHVKKQLVVQFCQVSGGPCVLDKPDMKKAHEGMDIRRSDFNALVEVLQHSMDTRGVPFSVQNRLLAKLAPMHREVVNTP